MALETNVGRVFYLGVAATTLFAAQMIITPQSALRQHLGLERATPKEEALAKAWAYSAAAGTAFAVAAFNYATPAARPTLLKMGSATFALPVLWHIQDDLSTRKAFDPPMRKMEMAIAAGMSALMAYFGMRP